MAHEISNVSGRDEVFVAGQPAWHGLGVRVDAAVTSEQAIKLAGLDWEVEQRDMYFAGKGGKCDVPDMVANVRKDKDGADVYLGGVGKSFYKIIQNREAFNFFDEVVGEKLAIYHTAGALKQGRRVWMLAELPENLVVGKKDTVKKYLLLVNAHDASMKLRMFFTPVRVVCNNTLTAALGHATDSEGISIPHYGDVSQKVEEAVRVLQIANKKYQELEKLYNQLAKCKVGEDAVKTYHKAVMPDEPDTNNSLKEKARGAMWNNYRHGMGADLSFGTMWGAYNSVTEYFDHTRYVGRKENAEGRMESVLFGGAHASKKAALELAAEALK